MKKFVPEYSKRRVNRAGEAFKIGKPSAEDHKVVENWRASHSHVLNVFQENLRRRAKEAKVRTPVQRLKRMDTIIGKLNRFPDMQLSRMHDIVGCRVVLENVDELNRFRKRFNSSRFDHKRRIKLTPEGDKYDVYNYIQHPKASGYRGIHDVYSYKAKQGGKLKNSQGGEKWNGLNIEIQYRTSIQHAWATAVEIYDQFTDSHAKFSDAPEEQKLYFQLTSEILARTYEESTGCFPEWTIEDVFDKFLDLESKFKVLKTLRGILPHDQNFDSDKNTLIQHKQASSTGAEPLMQIQTFRVFKDAVEAYFLAEKNAGPEVQVVLVSAEDTESVRFGFKNYFSDAREFVDLIDQAVTIFSDSYREKQVVTGVR